MLRGVLRPILATACVRLLYRAADPLADRRHALRHEPHSRQHLRPQPAAARGQSVAGVTGNWCCP